MCVPHMVLRSISLSDPLLFSWKTEDDRGMWLYRGYLIGDTDGTIVGRWRDTFSPPDFLGYEGSFMMTRRK